jgi:hypothetical protein
VVSGSVIQEDDCGNHAGGECMVKARVVVSEVAVRLHVEGVRAVGGTGRVVLQGTVIDGPQV